MTIHHNRRHHPPPAEDRVRRFRRAPVMTQAKVAQAVSQTGMATGERRVPPYSGSPFSLYMACSATLGAPKAPNHFSKTGAILPDR